MLVGRIEELPGTTVRVLGKSQGYFGLPVRFQVMFDTASGQEVDTMTTAWFPTPEELQRINDGEAIYLRLFGSSHPPVYMTVGGAEQHETQSFNGYTVKADPNTKDGTVELIDANGQSVARLKVTL